MKKVLTILCLLASMLLTQCRVYNGSFNTWFCTNSGPGTTYHLYINNSSKGILPYLPKAPNCSSDTLKKQALFLYMRSGKYMIEVKDEQGNLYYAGKITIKRNGDNISLGSSTTYKSVECRMQADKDCLINQIYFR